MATIVSALVFTIVDILGTPRTEAWFTLQFGEEYPNGGIAFDLSPYYKAVDFIQIGQVSGEVVRAEFSPATGKTVASGGKVWIQPRTEDYATPISQRFEVLALTSNVVAPITSAPSTAISGTRFLAHVIGY